MPTEAEPADNRTVYVEFVAVGAFMKVSAIDVETGIEVMITGPVGAAQSDLEKLALRRLQTRLVREGYAGRR
jgi:hypothetical protein